MEKFGKVDMVIVEADTRGGTVSRFLPVELQAVDITGSYLPYYNALVAGRSGRVKGEYGFNWANVRKRFVSQLIAKGYHCHQWGTRIVAVVQEDLFAEFEKHAPIVPTGIESSNIVFMLYQYVRASGVGAPWVMRLSRVVPTTHNSLMTAILYERSPDRAAFERKLLERIAR